MAVGLNVPGLLRPSSSAVGHADSTLPNEWWPEDGAAAAAAAAANKSNPWLTSAVGGNTGKSARALV